MTSYNNRRILIIDDNRAIHEDFRKILCPEKDSIDRQNAEFFGEAIDEPSLPVFELESAFQGLEGVEALRRARDEGRPYAMVFLDVRMPPGIDGIETAKLLWQLCPELQVVICTAYSDYSWYEMIGRLGLGDSLLVLKKPFTSIEALQLACALCEKWRLTHDAHDRLAETERTVEERTHELRKTNERLKAEMEERKKAESHLLRAQRLESIGTLAGGIAHDLNNMLSPILMSVSVLHDELPEQFQDVASTIESCAERAAEVVRHLLTFARGIEGERLPLQPADLIIEIEKIVAGTFPQNITFDRRLGSDLAIIEGDSTQLHQVLLNLCVNARDAMPDGGTLRVETDDFEVDESYASMVIGSRVGRYVRVRVSDTGSGIPRQIIDQIFDPFFTTKPLGKGTGLGLSTVLGIVKSHEGFLDVRSEQGRGTTFEIFLPVSSGLVSPSERGKEPQGRDGEGQLILVVDDESAIRKVTQAMLSKHGYRTLAAADGADAIALFARQAGDIDAILTDVMMPLVDGVALCRALRKIDSEVPIVAATGAAGEGRKPELFDLNVHSVLEKPYSTDTLLAALDDAFSSSRSKAGTPRTAS